MTSSKTKIVAAFIGFTMILGAVAGVQTANAQAMSLSQLVDLFISLGIISADKAAAAKAAVGTSATTGTTFTRNLTVGSTGADVTALQTKLGVSATGYFGSLTKAAVMSYQTANGIPSTGYVGPLTRAQLNAGSVVTTGGTTTGGSSVINTGVEGSITANKSSVSNSTLREGDTMRQVLGVKLEAKLSDINVQRIKLDLGANTTVYTKVFKTFYLTDDSGKVLAQADLNSNTVVKNGNNYELTLGGFSYTVAKDTTKYLWVKADLYSSIKLADQTTRTITLVANGVRGTDQAGIDQYAPTTAFSQSISLEGTLIDSAALKLSLNANNVKATDVVASEGTDDDEIDGVSVLNFDLKAEKDEVTVTDLTVDLVYSGSGAATATKAYLYDGSTLIDSEDVLATGGNTYVTFDDIDYVIAKDVTKTLTVKVDIRDANGTSRTVTMDIDAADVTAENSEGSTVTATGSAQGEGFVVRNVGAVFTLVGTPTITRQAVTANDTSGNATSTLTAVFNVRIKAVGSAVVFGASGSSTPSFATTSTTFASIYRNGSSIGSPATVAATPTIGGGTSAIVSYSTPSSGVTTIDSQTWSLADGNTVEIPVTYQLTVGGSSSNQYAVQLNGIRWQTTASNNSTFMTDKTEWRTSTVSLP
jgi:hypothetical protein